MTQPVQMTSPPVIVTSLLVKRWDSGLEIGPTRGPLLTYISFYMPTYRVIGPTTGPLLTYISFNMPTYWVIGPTTGPLLTYISFYMPTYWAIGPTTGPSLTLPLLLSMDPRIYDDIFLLVI